MKKYWKWITPVVAVLLVGLVIWFIFFYNSVPRLSDKEKEKVEQAYFLLTGSDDEWYAQNAIIWYDENGYVEENNVWRYLGKYGDCYAFLKFGDNKNSYMEKLELPCPVAGLDTPVYYPMQAFVMIYHTKQEFTRNEICGNYSSDSAYKLWNLLDVRNRDLLLTDEQFEQLTRDIEKLAKAHK